MSPVSLSKCRITKRFPEDFSSYVGLNSVSCDIRDAVTVGT